MSSNWPWKRNCLIGMTALVSAYVLLSPPVAWPLYNMALFRPSKSKIGSETNIKLIEMATHATTKDVRFPSANGKMLRGIFFELPETKKVFLVSEGCGGNIFRRLGHAFTLLKSGSSVFMYDYQGYGESDGHPSIDNACDDAVAAYDYLTQHEKRTGNDIIAFGSSFGCGPTGQLVARRPVSAVVLQSCYPSMLIAGRDTLPWLKLYPDFLFPHQMLDSVAVYTKPHPPLLIIHGTDDNVLSFKNAQALFNKASEQKILLAVKNGPHSCFGSEAEFITSLNRLLRKAPPAVRKSGLL